VRGILVCSSRGLGEGAPLEEGFDNDVRVTLFKAEGDGLIPGIEGTLGDSL
jgi:hypothetical protein